ncbi:MAG: hypothetical protein J6B67_05160 [Oscillospiraceae bacterium]|nr:hypothetical protein [Oscillospiraceae bacterium]
MNKYVQCLKEHLRSKPIDYGYSDAKSILDMLYFAYTQENPVENEEIRTKFDGMENILSQLSLDDNNTIFGLTCTLCAEYAHMAFLAGVHVGTCLYDELKD